MGRTGALYIEFTTEDETSAAKFGRIIVALAKAQTKAQREAGADEFVNEIVGKYTVKLDGKDVS